MYYGCSSVALLFKVLNMHSILNLHLKYSDKCFNIRKYLCSLLCMCCLGVIYSLYALLKTRFLLTCCLSCILLVPVLSNRLFDFTVVWSDNVSRFNRFLRLSRLLWLTLRLGSKDVSLDLVEYCVSGSLIIFFHALFWDHNNWMISYSCIFSCVVVSLFFNF